MTGIMHPSIRLQLLFPLVPLVLGLAATTAWTAWSAAEAAERQIRTNLDQIADTVRQVTFPRNAQTLRLMKGLSGAELLICDTQGLPSTDEQGRPLTTLATLPRSLPKPSADETPRSVRIDDAQYLCRSVPLQHDLLYMFFPESALSEAIWRAVRPALLVGVAGGLAAVLLSAFFTQRMTARILELQRRTRQIAGGDFSPMPVRGSQDELRDLSQSINEMAQQLARYQETSRATERLRLLGQVSGGLAHQLRNGVAGVRLALQVHARETPADESIGVALRQLALVEIYLRRFLDLGRTLEMKPEKIDLAELLRETVELLRPQCRHAGIELRHESCPAAEIVADVGQIRQVIFNVVSNAIEAAGPGGVVEVALHTDNDHRVLEVFDSGPGVAPAVQSRLFEPFATGKPEGVGLGLAVSRQILAAHGGRIDWARTGDRTCFRIEIPDRPVGRST
jgi:signal transduction histidine kinase